MRTLYLHIGMHKTGTTSIQQTLNKSLRHGSLIYANMKPYANHSVPIYTLFAEHPERHHIHRRRQASAMEVQIERDTLKHQLLQDITGHLENDFIISGEGIVSLDQTELSRLKEFFKRHFEKIVICAYIRPPAAYMESALQERIKNGWTQFDLEQVYPSYQDRFEKFEVLFGKENVWYWNYLPAEFKGGDVVEDFCSRLGVVKNFPTLRSNEGLSQTATSLLFKYWMHGPGYGLGRENIVANQRLVRGLQQLNGDKLRLCSEVVQPILDAHDEDLHWIEQRLGASIRNVTPKRETCICNEADLLVCSLEETIALIELLQKHLNVGEGERNTQTKTRKKTIKRWFSKWKYLFCH